MASEASDRQSIELTHHQRVVIVSLRNDLDLSDGTEVMLALDSARSDPGTAATLLDLAGLTFADSTLLNLILRAHLDHQTAARPFVLAGPYDSAVDRLFDITGVSDVLDLTGSLEDGLRHIDELLRSGNTSAPGESAL